MAAVDLQGSPRGRASRRAKQYRKLLNGRLVPTRNSRRHAAYVRCMELQ
jgi:hypothetical protein